MLDYRALLKASPRPEHTLLQAFVDVTGVGIDTRLLYKLINEYGEAQLLEAILAMVGKSIDKPVPYMISICKREETRKVIQPSIRKDKATAMLYAAKHYMEQPKKQLRNPFNAEAAT